MSIAWLTRFEVRCFFFALHLAAVISLIYTHLRGILGTWLAGGPFVVKNHE